MGSVMSTLQNSWGDYVRLYKNEQGVGVCPGDIVRLLHKCSFFPHHTRHIKGIRTPYPESEICSDGIADDYVAVKVYSGLYYRSRTQYVYWVRVQLINVHGGEFAGELDMDSSTAGEFIKLFR